MRSPKHLLIVAIFSLSRLSFLLAQVHNAFRHEAVEALHGRQEVASPLELIPKNTTATDLCPATSPTHPPILSIVYPSPDAAPVEITSQSQVVESYIPEMTWCVGPPMGLIPTATLTGPRYINDSTLYATTIAGTGSCKTIYVPTTKTVCATTLTGLASKVTVSECDQEITFSSECGFTLATPTPTISDFSMITPAPTVKRLMTYWLAPWQSLTLGESPSDVDIKVCTILPEETLECTRYQEVWEVVVVTQTITTERSFQISTTVSGPGTILVETLQARITDTIVFFNLSTTLHLETEVETETTSKSRKLISSPGEEAPTSTTYITKVVKYKTRPVRPQPSWTVRLTSIATRNIGTITRTRPRLPPRPTLRNFVPPI